MWNNLHLRLLEAKAGLAALECDLSREKHGQLRRKKVVIHNGAVAAIADSAMTCAGSTLLTENQIGTIVDLRVEFIEPAAPGLILAKARVRHRSNDFVFCEASLGQAGVTVAEAWATMAIADVARD